LGPREKVVAIAMYLSYVEVTPEERSRWISHAKRLKEACEVKE